MHWTQIYDPLGHWWLSTLVAAPPTFVLLFERLAGLKAKPHWCAIAGAAAEADQEGQIVVDFIRPVGYNRIQVLY